MSILHAIVIIQVLRGFRNKTMLTEGDVTLVCVDDIEPFTREVYLSVRMTRPHFVSHINYDLANLVSKPDAQFIGDVQAKKHTVITTSKIYFINYSSNIWAIHFDFNFFIRNIRV
jgi:hypothetical protein